MGRIIVMDTETTGLHPGKHDIIQIACIALQYNFQPDKAINPFYMLIQPKHFQDTEEYRNDIQPAMNVNKLSMKKIMEDGFHHAKAAELFEEWWKILGGQQIEPLCQNYPFDSSFMKMWLGPVAYSQFFSRYYRDTYAAARFIMDRSALVGDANPFPNGLSLGKLANVVGITHDNAHDALADCVTTAEVYRRLLSWETIPKKAT